MMKFINSYVKRKNSWIGFYYTIDFILERFVSFKNLEKYLLQVSSAEIFIFGANKSPFLKLSEFEGKGFISIKNKNQYDF